ncbi:MAG TPA: hypothetical protein VN690_11265 [Terriglobales bacterium]|nr:hypothetical protein [Terriglobales bacterium]
MTKPTPVPASLRLAAVLGVALAVLAAQSPNLSRARAARDHGDVAALQALARDAGAAAAQAPAAGAYVSAAQINAWLCEAALDRDQRSVCAQAAAAGAEAARQAIALDGKSSEAYRLRGGLLGQLISTGGMQAAMQYGAEATTDLDKAIALDPSNARAYVSRSISEFYTPEEFGGSKAKAVADLQKAVALDSKLDTPHLWLAQIDLASNQPAPALREAEAALKLDPNRVFAQYILAQARKAAGK